MEDSNSNGESVEHERSSSENVTIIAETFSDAGAGATVSSLKSENSTEHLICKTPQQKSGRKKVDTKAATPIKNEPVKTQPIILEYPKKLEASQESECFVDNDNEKSRLVLLLGLGQLLIGVCMVVFGALVIVHNASLSRVGAGLWSGCVAIATGMIGVLAGINDCYGLQGGKKSGRTNPFLTAFLALSLASLAAGNMAAVLAGTGIYRDTNGNQLPTEIETDLEEEKAAWTPVLTNIGLLIISTMHCLLAIVSIYHSSKRVCPCFRAKEPYNHNQFYPDFKNIPAPYIIVSEKPPKTCNLENKLRNDLCKELELKLSGTENTERRLRRPSEGTKEGHGSANSTDKLVTSWLGRHPSSVTKAVRPTAKNGVRKMKMKPQPIVLVPAHPASTMGRAVPVPMMPVAPRYATLPILQPPPPHYRGTIYYPLPTAELGGGRRKRRSPRSNRQRGHGASRDNRLTRSLERMHRNAVRDKALTDADVIKTYTGLDRAIAEQFIVACNETRNTISNPVDKTDSSGFDTASSECHSNRF